MSDDQNLKEALTKYMTYIAIDTAIERVDPLSGLVEMSRETVFELRDEITRALDLGTFEEPDFAEAKRILDLTPHGSPRDHMCAMVITALAAKRIGPLLGAVGTFDRSFLRAESELYRGMLESHFGAQSVDQFEEPSTLQHVLASGLPEAEVVPPLRNLAGSPRNIGPPTGALE